MEGTVGECIHAANRRVYRIYEKLINNFMDQVVLYQEKPKRLAYELAASAGSVDRHFAREVLRTPDIVRFRLRCDAI